MRCDKCTCGDSTVVDSRPSGRFLGAIRRRRECCGCGARWTTIESRDHSSLLFAAGELERCEKELEQLQIKLRHRRLEVYGPGAQVAGG